MLQTSVTRGRLKRLRLILGDQLDQVLHKCGEDEARAEMLEALCVLWFGPICRRPPRSDRGSAHNRPQRQHWAACYWCHGEFLRSRPDACWCSNACRQAAYRARRQEAP
jgi:hypothetical protein